MFTPQIRWIIEIGLLVGVLAALPVVIVAGLKNQRDTGAIACLCCVFAGIFFGIKGAIPTAIGFCIMIISRQAKKEN
jgi:hypothetical protein